MVPNAIYLSHGYRKLGKVRKVRIYLGKNLKEDELNKKKIEAENKLKKKLSSAQTIRDPYKIALSYEEMQELEKLSPEGRIKLSHLSEDNWLRFTESFAYDTNAIEDSTVESKEVAEIIEKKSCQTDLRKRYGKRLVWQMLLDLLEKLQTIFL